MSFGIGDILRGYFRPTNLRGIGGFTRVPIKGKKNKAGKFSKFKEFTEPPEIGNEIGKALPGSEFFQARKVTGIERWVWTIDGVAQRFLWWWLVADVTEQFVVNWTTAIMESEACRKDEIGGVSAYSPEMRAAGVDGWTALFDFHTIADTTPNLWNDVAGYLIVPFGTKCTYAFYARSAAGVLGINTGNQLGVGELNSGIVDGDTTPWPVGPTDDPQLTAITGVIYGPAVIHFMVYPRGSGLQLIGEGTMTASITYA